MANEALKRCSKCREDKPVGDFAKHKTNGYQAYCRPCSLAHSRAWAAANKEKKREHKMNSRHSDIERDRANRRRHYERHAERLREESSAT